jgi:hypothetical protein
VGYAYDMAQDHPSRLYNPLQFSPRSAGVTADDDPGAVQLIATCTTSYRLSDADYGYRLIFHGALGVF